LVILLGSFK